MAEGKGPGGGWLAGVLVAVIGGTIVWALTHPGGPLNPSSPSAPPHFEVLSADQNGSCTVNGGCPVIAAFRNDGGSGSAGAVLSLVDNNTGRSYGTCTTDIPSTDHNSVSKASCTVFSSQISQYLQSIPFGQHVNIPAHVTAEAKNPNG